MPNLLKRRLKNLKRGKIKQDKIQRPSDSAPNGETRCLENRNGDRIRVYSSSGGTSAAMLARLQPECGLKPVNDTFCDSPQRLKDTGDYGCLRYSSGLPFLSAGPYADYNSQVIIDACLNQTPSPEFKNLTHCAPRVADQVCSNYPPSGDPKTEIIANSVLGGIFGAGFLYVLGYVLWNKCKRNNSNDRSARRSDYQEIPNSSVSASSPRIEMR